jgi:hypothetical protein
MTPVRLLVAALVWAGAIGGVAGLTQVADDYARGGSRHAGAAATTTPAPSRPREPTDISRDLPSRPAGTLPADGGDSLFRRTNLERVLAAVQHRFGPQGDLIAFALYPEEADFVVVRDGLAQVVRAPADGGALDVGDRTGFEGTRTAVTVQQIRAAAIARTLHVVVTRGHIELADIDRVVLDLTSFGNLAGYRIEPISGLTTYKALLTGGRVDRVGPGGTRQLR